MSKLRSRLTYANVASSLALFLAVSGGTALAAAQIGTRDIERGAVTTSRIASQAVTSGKIRNNTITSRDVQNGSLRAVDFADGELPQGPQGPAGPQGPQGPAGPGGASATGVISTAGTLVYGKGVAAVSVAGPGVYTVSFDQNVSQCPATATVGGFQLGGNTQTAPNGGTVSLQPGGTANATAAQQITFITRDLQTNANTPLPFHFAVFC